MVEWSTEGKNSTGIDITNNMAVDNEDSDKMARLSETVTNPDGSSLMESQPNYFDHDQD